MLSRAGELTSEAEARIRRAQLISLFLDFDGTLVPIEATPTLPELDPATAEAVRNLARCRGYLVTIISGRTVRDLYSRIRLDSVIYAGNHGFEIEGPQIHFMEP